MIGVPSVMAADHETVIVTVGLAIQAIRAIPTGWIFGAACKKDADMTVIDELYAGRCC